ncbi:hypothetical protein ACS15_3434 [Ralstonia insidiosa]|uniref:Uncharacterized protein n=1 Tax=Ralstonia insidiosa TaxID=190721 RepID=A0AAC9BEX4_9RALS|nr:hypothetical protein ACS15_3434 [Ralstonia insidiosa]
MSRVRQRRRGKRWKHVRREDRGGNTGQPGQRSAGPELCAN